MARVVAEDAYARRVECTGRGNGDDGCGRLIEIKRPDLFNTNVGNYAPTIGFACPACRKHTDLRGDDWPEQGLEEITYRVGPAWTAE